MACYCNGECPVVAPIRDKLQRGNRGGAEHDLKLALTDAPNCVEANLMLADILNITNRADAAQTHLSRAATVENKTPRMWLADANNIRARSKPDLAAVIYGDVLSGEPSNADAHAGKIMALHHAGAIEKAEAATITALEACPHNPEIERAGAAVLAEKKDFAGAITMLEGKRLPAALLDRGRYKDRLSDYAGAWEDWMAGKAQLRRRQGFNRRAFNRLLEGLLDMAAKRKQESMGDPLPIPAKGFPAPSPIFVTGFTRSGTTMFETAIAAHSKITAADELPNLMELTRMVPDLLHVPLPYPQAMAALNFGENEIMLGIMREIYMRKAALRVGPWKKGTKFFTDKMPLNELHLPLMLRLFPESPIFYVRRHPLDIIVSNLSYTISHGFNCTTGLRTLAYAYAAVDALLVKYFALWPARVHVVRYEDFVSDHRHELGRAFATIGLPVEEACFNFHESGRHSRTISNRQIKEPLYDRSVGRYKNYMPQLEPILDIVRPICDREGYAI